jgi:peptidoglycan/LPS O-acetylase OafA/YrhL
VSDRTQDRGRAAAVDGLRAVAALSVLGYHAWLYTRDRVSAGVRGSLADELAHELRLGLVLFFVLSGYLLYGPWVRAALDEASAPRTAAYLVRRAARIVPAYYAAVVGSIVLLWGLDATPGVRLPAADDLWLFALFGQNFSVDTLLSLNAPLWTLAVEWSFYLMLPVLGWLALRLRGASREVQAIVPTLFLVAGVGWNWWIAGEEVPPTLTKVLPAMAPYFAVGMLAALLAHGRALGRRGGWALLAAGIALVGADAWWAALAAREGSHDLTLHVLRDLVGACGFGAILLGVTLAPAPRVLGARPLAAVGVWSYGVYLWHVPLLLWLRGNDLLPASGPLAFLVVLPLSLVVAAASWRLLERPAQAWARGATQRSSENKTASGGGRIVDAGRRTMAQPMLVASARTQPAHPAGRRRETVATGRRRSRTAS